MPHTSNGHLGRLATGAALGLAAGLAIPAARKALMQTPSVAAGDWQAALKAEHRMVEKAFEMALETRQSDAAKREMLLTKIAYALTKHAIQEENVIYPSLVMQGREAEARHLIDDHGKIKTFIFELRSLSAAEPAWRTTLQSFFTDLQAHIREEEDEVFPAFEASLTPHDNARLTRMMNWEGFKVA